MFYHEPFLYSFWQIISVWTTLVKNIYLVYQLFKLTSNLYIYLCTYICIFRTVFIILCYFILFMFTVFTALFITVTLFWQSLSQIKTFVTRKWTSVSTLSYFNPAAATVKTRMDMTPEKSIIGSTTQAKYLMWCLELHSSSPGH